MPRQVPTPRTVEIPSAEAVAKERERLQYKKKYNRTLRSTIYALLVVAALAVLVATIFLPVLQVSGTSMEPTLADGDIILLLKSESFTTGDICGLYWQNKLLLKRVIGGPGDIIDIDAAGNVAVNGQELDEPYLTDKALGECDITLPYQVPENRYFVMGDHRSTSVDSRSSTVGCVSEEQIVGKIVFRVWPLNQMGRLK